MFILSVQICPIRYLHCHEDKYYSTEALKNNSEV